MTCKEVVQMTRDDAARALVRRAALLNAIAGLIRRRRDAERLRVHQLAVVSRLLVLQAAQVEEVVVSSGLIQIALPDGLRMQVDISELSPDARQHVGVVIGRPLGRAA